jgi:hypothetical protein
MNENTLLIDRSIDYENLRESERETDDDAQGIFFVSSWNSNVKISSIRTTTFIYIYI